MDATTILSPDRIVSEKEILTYYRNYFNDKLMGSMLDLRHYKRVESKNPAYQIIQNGISVGIAQLIKSAQDSVFYARENVKEVDALLKIEEDGKLADEYQNEKIGVGALEEYKSAEKE